MKANLSATVLALGLVSAPAQAAILTATEFGGIVITGHVAAFNPSTSPFGGLVIAVEDFSYTFSVLGTAVPGSRFFMRADIFGVSGVTSEPGDLSDFVSNASAFSNMGGAVGAFLNGCAPPLSCFSRGTDQMDFAWDGSRSLTISGRGVLHWDDPGVGSLSYAIRVSPPAGLILQVPGPIAGAGLLPLLGLGLLGLAWARRRRSAY